MEAIDFETATLRKDIHHAIFAVCKGCIRKGRGKVRAARNTPKRRTLIKG
jgi:hypothetical protein